MIKTGAEERDVPCEEIIDYRAGEVRVMRMDTKEVYSRRALTKDEHQLHLEAQKPSGKLLPMDGGKGKQEPVEEMGCVECWGTGKVKIGEPPLDAKCEVCNGSGRVPVKPDPLKATLGDVAAQHAKNKADAEQAGAGGEGHPEVEKLLKKRGRGKGKKGDEEGPPIDPETGEPAAF
jgi:DnaJ-class molecular chaperone